MSLYKRNVSLLTLILFVAVVSFTCISVLDMHAKAKGKAASENQVYIDYNYIVSFLNLYQGNVNAAISSYEKVIPYLQTPESYDEYTTMLLYAKKSAQAEKVLKKALKLFPKNKMLYKKLLDVLIIEGKSAEAIKWIKSDMSLFKNKDNIYKKLAILYMRNSNYSKAIQYFKKIKNYEKNGDILFYIAQCYDDMGNDNEAIVYLKKLLSHIKDYRTDKNYVAANIFLAKIYESRKQFDKAIDVYKNMKVVRYDEVLSAIGNDYYRWGKIHKAFIYFKKAYNSFRDISYAEKAVYMLMRLGQYKKVIGFIDKNRVPLSTDKIKYFYGVSLMSNKQYEKAIDVFKKISPSSILYKDALYNEISCYNKLGMKNKAIDVLESAKHKDKDIYYMLADLYIQYKDYKKAVSTILNNINVFKDKARAYFYVADVYYNNLHNNGKAIEYLKKSLMLNPKSSVVLNYLGYLYIDENIDIDKGIKFVKEALKLEPDNPYYIDSLGWGYYKKGEYEKAIPLLTKALKNTKKTHPTDSITIKIHLAKTYIKAKESNKAKKLLESILKQSPKNKEAKKLLNSLK